MFSKRTFFKIFALSLLCTPLMPLHAGGRRGKKPQPKVAPRIPTAPPAADPVERLMKEEFPLHMAIILDQHKYIPALIEHGCDVDQCNDKGISPLHYATMMDKVNSIDPLLESGANIDLFCSIKKNDPNDDDIPMTSLGIAAIANLSKAAILLMQREANRMRVTESGMTVLHAASLGNNVHIINYLREEVCFASEEERRSFMNIRSDLGSTALHTAVSAGALGALRTLLAQGANTEIQDACGDTPLKIAQSNKTQNMAWELMQAGAAVDLSTIPDKPDPLDPTLLDTEQQNEGPSPLFKAVDENDCVTLSGLLDNGWNPQEKNGDGASPLHIAASKGHDEVAQMLFFEKDVNFDAVDNAGNSPLDYLVQHAVQSQTVNSKTVAKFASRSSHETRTRALRKAIDAWEESSQENNALAQCVKRILVPLLPQQLFKLRSCASELPPLAWDPALPIKLPQQSAFSLSALFAHHEQKMKALMDQSAKNWDDDCLRNADTFFACWHPLRHTLETKNELPENAAQTILTAMQAQRNIARKWLKVKEECPSPGPEASPTSSRKKGVREQLHDVSP